MCNSYQSKFHIKIKMKHEAFAWHSPKFNIDIRKYRKVKSKFKIIMKKINNCNDSDVIGVNRLLSALVTWKIS